MATNVDVARGLLTMFSGAVDSGALSRTIDEVLIPQFVLHGSALSPFVYGRDATKQRALATKSAFPDAQVTVEQIFSEGARVMAHARFAATHLGQWRGIPATGRRVTWTVTGIVRFNDQGQAAEGWLIEDSVGMLQQLGRLPLIPGQQG